MERPGLVAGALLVVGLVGGLGASWLVERAPGVPADGLAFGSPSAWGGIRKVSDTSQNAERVVIVTVPYTYRGGPAHIVLTLFVSDDPSFSSFVGFGTQDATLDEAHASGTLTVVARVHAGGVLHWQLSPSVLSGSARVPAPLEGVVRFNESMASRN